MARHDLHRQAPKRHVRRGLVVRMAMFDNLTQSVTKAIRSLDKDAQLTAENIKVPIKEVRRALLEADVSLPVVRRFIKKVEQKVLGIEVIKGVNPQTQFTKAVYDELVELMGSAGAKDLEPGFPQIILMAGLQGVGKTTVCGKLAAYLQKRGRRVMMVATDVYRPAAIDQLVKLGTGLGVPVFEMGRDADPVEIARRGVEEARRSNMDAVIVDTAGRLQVDEEMMAELRRIKEVVRPSDTLLVVDAMTGQEAANLVKAFNDEVDISGAILTKMDGDSRGGAALSVREVSGKPIKFVGVGEKMDDLEPFYPERMASRVLDAGDMLTLFEKAQSAIKEEEARAIAQRMMASKFDFNDFLKQLDSLSNMGGLKVMKLLPGFSNVSEKALYEAEKQFAKFKEMGEVMTQEERADPEVLTRQPAARRRIAAESGHSEKDVSEMLEKFLVMRTQMGRLGKMLSLSGGGNMDEKAVKDMVKSAMKPVAPGKVRRKKEKKDSGKGFGAPAGRPAAGTAQSS